MHRLIDGLDEIARRDDPAEVLAQLARVVVAGLGQAVVVSTQLLPVVPLVMAADRGPVERGRLAQARALCARREEVDRSRLLSDAYRTRAPVSSRLPRDGDVLVAVREVFEAEVVTVVPLCSGPRVVGFFAVYGPPLRPERVQTLRVLSAVAANALERTVGERRAHDEVRVRDASIAMLGSLVEHDPLPWVLVDERRRMVGWNDAFERGHAPRFGASVSELACADRLTPIVDEVLDSGRSSLSEWGDHAWQTTLVGANPVMVDGATSGVGLRMVDLSAARGAERAARLARAAIERVHDAHSVADGYDVAAQLGVEVFGGWSVCLPAARARHSAGAVDPACFALATAVALRTGAGPVVLSADELALWSLQDPQVAAALDERGPTALLSLPLGGAVLCVGREQEFSVQDAMFAAELASALRRALSHLAERDELRARALLAEDYAGLVARDVSDRLTETVMECFFAERASAGSTGGVQRSLRRLCQSVHELLASAPRAPRSTAEPVDLVEVVTPLVAELRAPSLVRLEPVSRVTGDGGHLRDALGAVLQHVVGQAQEGELVCARVESFGPKGDEVLVTFSHGGRGHSVAESRRVFDAFWHGDARGRALSVARAVVASFGGRSWVETGEGSGAAYSFAFPALGAPLEATLSALDQARDLREEGVAVERLDEAAVDPERPGARAPVGGGDDRRDGRQRRLRALQLAEPEPVDVRHLEVEDDQRRHER